MSKKVGIITMHKVWNVGSALQAYATQKIIDDLGFSSELIDYKYPNTEHSAFQGNIKEVKHCNIKNLIRVILQKIKAKFTSRKINLYKEFYNNYFKCSPQEYKTRKSIIENPPLYDIYVTGSDQVWNPKYIGFDTNYFLDFAPDNKKKISYASSFSSSTLSDYFSKLYAEKLKRFDAISVRETTGQYLIENMVGKKPEVVCDPTILLNEKEWTKIANASTIKPKEQYILVYILGYAYNPYPEIYNYIERVNKELQLPVIYLNTIKGRLNNKFKEIKITNWGPIEFLYLIKNAKFVITDSFHGTAFSLNFSTPFISCVKSKESSDSRMLDLLRIVNAEDRAVTFNQNDEIIFDPLQDSTKTALNNYRNKSLIYLKNSLEV